jgi:hypothetical protein
VGITSSSSGIGIAAAQNILSSRAAIRDGETRLAATLHHSSQPPERAASGALPAPPRSAASDDVKMDHVAAEIARRVESRLPGRVRQLRVQVVEDQFVLSGASSSYYVKQVAQHLAMIALDSHMLGRLVNEIEVT